MYLTACQFTPNKLSEHPQESAACMEYRAMMTAPMPPQEMEKLKQKCISSQTDVVNP